MPKLELVFLVIFGFWISTISYFLLKITKQYQRLIEGTDKRKLSQILENVLDTLKNEIKIKNDLEKLCQELLRDKVNYIQKVGVYKFNPFANTGGEQSFILSILDGKDDGIVITSLHTRESSRWYVKNVREGKGEDIQLSKEEQEAIKRASKLKKLK